MGRAEPIESHDANPAEGQVGGHAGERAGGPFDGPAEDPSGDPSGDPVGGPDALVPRRPSPRGSAGEGLASGPLVDAMDSIQPAERGPAPRAYTGEFSDPGRLSTKAFLARQRAKARSSVTVGSVTNGFGAVRTEGPVENEGDALARTIRRWAKTTSVDELAARGVKTVRSVSMARMGALLEKAVNRALIERTLDSDPGDALSLSSSARETFLELTRSEVAGEAALDEAPGAEPLEGTLQSRATSTLDRLKRELEDRRKAFADHEKQLSDGEIDTAEDNKLRTRLSDLFATYARPGDDRTLERETSQLVLTELRKSRRRARQARLEEHHREISTLERRITKLAALLGETEDALRQVKLGRSLDPGVSSIYDTVQGLTEVDGMYEKKSGLMKSIFDANLALRS